MRKLIYIYLSIFISMMSCAQSNDGSITQTGNPKEEHKEMSKETIRIYINHTRDQFQIGEWIPLKLEINNHGEEDLVFSGIRMEYTELAFAPELKPELIGPSGENLLLPFIGRPIQERPWLDFTITPGSSRDYDIFFHNAISFTQPGKYRLNVPFVDVNGVEYSHEPIEFEIMDMPVAEGISLEIKGPDAVPVKGKYPLEITFVNNSKEDKIFYLPQEASESLLAYPFYWVQLKSEAGYGCTRGGFDEFEEPDYGRSQRISLDAGESHTMKYEVAGFECLREEGKLEMTLEYILRDDALGFNGNITDEKMSWKRGTFKGRLVSNTISFDLRNP